MNDYYKICSAQNARLKDHQQMHLFQHSLKHLIKKWKVKFEDIQHFYQVGFLSFEPHLELDLEPIQEAELSFVLSLKQAGCNEDMMRTLLSSLQTPYCYDREKLMYDFSQKKWLTRLAIRDNELTIEGRIKQAKQDKNVRALRDIIQEASRALMQVAEESLQNTNPPQS